MATDHHSERDEWRLGGEPAERHPAERVQPIPLRPREYPRERLERQVAIVTAEGLYWTILALYAVISRLLFLGSRPLSPREAIHAATALDTIRLGIAPAPPNFWIQMLDAATIGLFGASDFGARILFALSGIALVLIALALRPYIGKIGALAMATLILLSPSITYFSRSGVTQGPALLAVLIAIELWFAIARTPNAARSAGLGCVIGLSLAANAQNLVLALIFVAALLVIGTWRLTITNEAWMRVRIWWRRRSRLLIVTALVAVLVWTMLETGFYAQPFLTLAAAAARSNWQAAAPHGSALPVYLGLFGFYEFLIVAAAIIGALAMLLNLAGARSEFGIFALLWTILAAGFFMTTPAFAPAWIIEILIPAALLGGIGLEALSRTWSWNLFFYPLATLALLTFYVQIATNFAVVAPDPSEAPWARHALLFWSEPVTTIGIADALHSLEDAAPITPRTAWIESNSAVLKWYLRDLKPAENAVSADLIAGASKPPPGWRVGNQATFEAAEWWHPDFSGLSPRRAVLFLLLQSAWQPFQSRETTVLVRSENHSAPTTIYAPPPALPAAISSPGAIAGVETGPAASTATPTASPTPSPATSSSAAP
ncbi:MAG: hypothetical protein IVW54_07095 [Candidatus Binataceae bacterium]|nr:hypothetical protein [Candidatus Binataceae bacterium]